MIATLHELHRDPKKRSTQYQAVEFHPYRKFRPKLDRRPELTPEQFGELFADG